MNRTIKRAVITTAAAIVAISAAAAFTVLYTTRADCVKTEREIYLPTGSDYGALLDSLGRETIRFRRVFDLYARHIGLDRNVKGGHYTISSPMTVIGAARMFNLGLQTPVMVKINNVRTPAHLAGKLARQIEADSAAILSTLTDKKIAEQVGFDSLTLFSMFIPNSYEFYWTVTPEQLVKRMRREYDAFWTAERDAKRSRSGLSRLEVMTLASIVNEETRQSDEMATVAGVYVNRLRRGQKLQADPTVKYAVGDFSLRRILHSHLKVESPYNTYLHAGLPPSPICMPSIEAIDGVLDFEEHKYLYFCARPTFDGHHNFAATYSEHLRNARAYTSELNKRKIYK